MSGRELAYMTNEDFDLPRWQTQSGHEHTLSSSQQAAQAASQASYLYPHHSGGGGIPPPPPSLIPASSNSMRLHQQQSPQGASRQMRINQLLDPDNASGGQYSPGGTGGGNAGNSNLSRSTSLGGAFAGRNRRPRAQDDLEGAFHDDGGQDATSSAYAASAYYTPSAPSHAHTHSAASAGSGDHYSESYFTPANGLSPRRAHTQRDPTSSSVHSAAQSPRRTDVAPLADPYSPPTQQPQQAQYSPSVSGYGYGDRSQQQQQQQQRANPPTPYTHSRSHSRVSASDAAGAYQSPPQTSSAYGAYPMDVSTSPNPPALLGTPAHVQMSHSTPSSPHAHNTHYHGSHSLAPSPYYSAPDPHAMAVEPAQPQRRRVEGFRRVRDARDLQPRINPRPDNRRLDPLTGEYLSPLRQLTLGLCDTYRLCNAGFRYESSHNPRRVLTKPSKPVHNDGYDNEDYDYILYVNDVLGSEKGERFVILDILGQGTFGQVVKCQNIKTHEIVAVKVVKNKPAYFNQSMMEVTILELLNNEADPNDEHHILRLRASFIHKSHLCLVFELLSSNLYELIKQNQFQGLSTQLVKVFTSQLLDALTVLKEARLIHCDLKPENILLKSLQSPQIKVIDFGSACHERQTVYTYIQSRFYRSPEVLLGIPYTAAIDMWSLGCIAVELFLGLPLFPGTSEYNQITRIVEMLGLPPQQLLDRGKQTNQFFDVQVDGYGQKKYRLKSLDQYSREHNTNEQPGKQYFNGKLLPDIINNTPMPAFKSSRTAHETEKELNNRASFIDFCQGLLNMDPVQRWTPVQARMHPFITGEKWTKPWKPSQVAATAASQLPTPASTASPVDPKRPYGGLVPSQPKGTRAYQDAAAYNQHLAQHQAYTAQAAANQAAQSQVLRNPYLTGQPPAAQPQPPPASSYASPEKPPSAYVSPSQQSQPYPQQQQSQQTERYQQPQQQQQRPLAHQSSQGHLGLNTGGLPQYASHPSATGSNMGVGAAYLNPNPPANAYHGGGANAGGGRARANTIHPIDNIPPALARLQHMNHDVIGGRNALTPVMNRGDDALLEWERRKAGKPSSSVPYPQLELLHQQAELAASQGLGNWNATAQRYHPPQQSKLAQSYHPTPPQGGIVMDDDRRDAVMSNVRSAARGEPANSAGGIMYGSGSGNNPGSAISSPPQAYTSNVTTAGNRYASAYAQQQAPPQQQPGTLSPFDGRSDVNVNAMYAPMQPDHQYSGYGSSSAGRQVAQPAQALAPSFYGAGMIPGTQGQQDAQMSGGGQDSRRTSAMDVWPR